MSFEVTANRKRPQLFESLIGQEFVVSTLKNAIEQGRIAHAYLFAGPRGVGKTTCARLLAKALNCQNGPTSNPCGECDNCKGIAKGSNLDVIEIDGASNTGVNDVRVIKEEVLFPPTSSKYKIYIIDEVHMLSQSAFNALLKTIEEPPEYVVFIFATTETQKVPATIRSRCQQFNFQLIPLEKISGLLKQACDETGITAEDEALFWIAKESTGSMRDAYTLFDQVVSFSNGNITMDLIREKLGLVGIEQIIELMNDVLSNRIINAHERIQTLLVKGISVEQIIKDFSEFFRSLLLIKEGVKNESTLGVRVNAFPKELLNVYSEEQLENALEMFMSLYRDIRYSLNPRFELELAVSKLGKLRYAASNITVMERLEKLKRELETGVITPKTGAVLKDSAPVEKPVEKPVENTLARAVDTPLNPTVANQSEKPLAKEENKKLKPLPKETESLNQRQIINPDFALQNALPQGVGKVTHTDQGLVLEYGSRFFYQAALKDIDRIRKTIQDATNSNINVIIGFSQELEEQRSQQFRKEEEIKEFISSRPVKQEIREDDTNGKYVVNDILSMFKGHEEK